MASRPSTNSSAMLSRPSTTSSAAQSRPSTTSSAVQSRPSTTSSASSSTEAIAQPAVGSSRDPPLSPPRPLFFINRRGDGIEEEQRDPFRTPDVSAPGTPGTQAADNPFSPPGSVISMSLDGPQGTTTALGSRMQSRVSINSSLRSGPEPRPTLGSRVSSQIRDSFMSPPAMSRRATAFESNVASRLSVAAPRSKRLRSSMLTGTIEKPWVGERDVYGRVAYFMTYLIAFLGIAGSVLRCYFAWKDVPRVGNLCLIMEDNFDTFDTDYTWSREIDMSGFGCVARLHMFGSLSLSLLSVAAATANLK